jgi:hypothetical protein
MLDAEYVAKAMQDARRFQGCWDAGTSGTLAAHTFRLIRERETLLKTIEDLERELAELRQAVQAKSVGAVPEVFYDGIPADYAKLHRLEPATVAEQPTFDEPIPVATSMPPEQLEALWNGIRERREAMLARIRGEQPAEPINTTKYERAEFRLVGMTGRAGSGKSVSAGMIPGAVVIQLADPLYAALSTMTGIPEVLLRHREQKERPIEWLGKSPRQMLQSLGTEWGRETVAQDIWLQLCRRRINQLREQGISMVVVADVRFENEATMIREAGGRICHVRRPMADSADVEHKSEAGIQMLDGDVLVVNDGTIEDLRRKVEEAFSAAASAA